MVRYLLTEKNVESTFINIPIAMIDAPNSKSIYVF